MLSGLCCEPEYFSFPLHYSCLLYTFFSINQSVLQKATNVVFLNRLQSSKRIAKISDLLCCMCTKHAASLASIFSWQLHGKGSHCYFQGLHYKKDLFFADFNFHLLLLSTYFFVCVFTGAAVETLNNAKNLWCSFPEKKIMMLSIVD